MRTELAAPADASIWAPRAYGILSTIEASFGAVVLMFTVLFGIGLAGLFAINEELGRNVPRWPGWVRAGAIPVWLLALVLGCLSLRAFAGRPAQVRPHPLVLVYALARTPSRFAPMRWIVGFWWWTLAAVVVAFTVCYATRDPSNGRGIGLAVLALHLVPELGASVATNGCLLIGFYHLTRSERLTRAASRVRLLIDLGIAVATMTIDVAAYRVP